MVVVIIVVIMVVMVVMVVIIMVVVIMVVIMVVISCLTMTAQLGDGAATSPLPWLQFLGYSEKSPINQRSPIKRVINHL